MFSAKFFFADFANLVWVDMSSLYRSDQCLVVSYTVTDKLSIRHFLWSHEQSTLSQATLSQHGKVGCQCVFRRRRRKRPINNTYCLQQKVLGKYLILLKA